MPRTIMSMRTPAQLASSSFKMMSRSEMELFFKSWKPGGPDGSVDDPVHLVQQHALEAERCHQHLFALLRQFLHGKVLEDVGRFLADAEVGGDEGVVGIKLTGLLVVVAGTDLGDVGAEPVALFLVMRVSLEWTL